MKKSNSSPTLFLILNLLFKVARVLCKNNKRNSRTDCRSWNVHISLSYRKLSRVESHKRRVVCSLSQNHIANQYHCIRLIHVVLRLVFSEFISIGKLSDLFTWRSSKTTLETVKLEPTLIPRTHIEWFQNYIYLCERVSL